MCEVATHGVVLMGTGREHSVNHKPSGTHMQHTVRCGGGHVWAAALGVRVHTTLIEKFELVRRAQGMRHVTGLGILGARPVSLPTVPPGLPASLQACIASGVMQRMVSIALQRPRKPENREALWALSNATCPLAEPDDPCSMGVARALVDMGIVPALCHGVSQIWRTRKQVGQHRGKCKCK